MSCLFRNWCSKCSRMAGEVAKIRLKGTNTRSSTVLTVALKCSVTAFRAPLLISDLWPFSLWSRGTGGPVLWLTKAGRESLPESCSLVSLQLEPQSLLCWFWRIWSPGLGGRWWRSMSHMQPCLCLGCSGSDHCCFQLQSPWCGLAWREAVSEWVTERVLREDKSHTAGLTMSDPQIMVPNEP